MMYDENVLVSFSKRVLENYKTNKTEDNEVTLALCSLAGILSILDDEARKDIFKDSCLPDYIKTEDNLYVDRERDCGLKNIAIIRHFRNSLCHLKLNENTISKNAVNRITAINFRDYYQGGCNFECKLKVGELGQFCCFLVETITKKLSKIVS